jgi:2-oxoglutarate dehydrogenase E2 component (dihydrolipoamide succinyltransferase)
MAIELKVPVAGESITEVEIGQWLKAKGDPVKKDEPVVTLESEKATVELPAPVSGVISNILKKNGDSAAIGEVIAYIEKDGEGEKAGGATEPAKLAEKPKPEERRVMPSASRAMAQAGMRAEEVRPTGPGGRVLKEDVLREAETRPAEARNKPQPEPPPARARAPGLESKAGPPAIPVEEAPPGREEQAVRMTRLRRTVAEHLVEAQNTMALLTTFNEIDVSAVQALRKAHGENFQNKYKVKLGLMSFFVKASIEALKFVPEVNAEIRGTEIVYHNYYDIGVAIAGGKGLVVPVLQNAERLSFAEIELAIGDFAHRAQENKLTIDELQGGTFTITNGGVFGSLLSTPIVNPPQSGILGMHAIQDRPVAREGNVVIRPMMYVALTYDHRIVDGREAVTFLKRIKELVENPARILIEV